MTTDITITTTHTSTKRSIHTAKGEPTEEGVQSKQVKEHRRTRRQRIITSVPPEAVLASLAFPTLVFLSSILPISSRSFLLLLPLPFPPWAVLGLTRGSYYAIVVGIARAQAEALWREM